MDVILERTFDCLGDYTINQKGDVGSLVRVEAINAVLVLLNEGLVDKDDEQRFVAEVGGLAVEKLDKVRWNAWNCIKSHMSAFGIRGVQTL